MEQKKEKGLRIRSCLTGAIWLALVFSTVISALLFAFLNHFFNLPGSIPVLGWLLIFNTLIAGLHNGKILIACRTFVHMLLENPSSEYRHPP